MPEGKMCMSKDDLLQEILMLEVKNILNETEIYLTDNFIELGGNSFLAIQVALNLKDKEGIDISIAELLGDRLENVSIKRVESVMECVE